MVFSAIAQDAEVRSLCGITAPSTPTPVFQDFCPRPNEVPYIVFHLRDAPRVDGFVSNGLLRVDVHDGDQDTKTRCRSIAFRIKKILENLLEFCDDAGNPLIFFPQFLIGEFQDTASERVHHYGMSFSTMMAEAP